MSPAATLDRLLPSALLKASALLHVGAGGAWLAGVPWPLALGPVVADHLLLTACGLWPRSALLGPNWTHLPEPAAARGEVAITIDDGPDTQVTPAVLELLAEHQARATFFCVGERIARHPQLARAIVAGGHCIENHTQHHYHHFSCLGPGALRREIAQAQAVIAGASGSEPLFFRAPAGLRSPLLQPQLSELGLRLASWTRRGFDTVNRDAAAVLAKLSRGLRAGDILLLHDGSAARTPEGAPVILEVLGPLLRSCAAAGLRTVTLRAALAQG
ncbi:MAG TPA: polysaccharide deacetylase family protein [Steroidobacteraceae bacterium]|nr:polysaccharide deacetylase family protein [Steroidobacteraceae bacterium]